MLEPFGDLEPGELNSINGWILNSNNIDGMREAFVFFVALWENVQTHKHYHCLGRMLFLGSF